MTDARERERWWIRAITEDDVRKISTWKYPEPYSLYDASPDDAQGLLDPANDYVAVVDSAGQLVAHACFGADARVPGGRYEDDAIDLGTGMRPDLTGGGNGRMLIELVMDEARKRWPGRKLRTTVASFNERSMHLVRKCGLSEVEVFRNPAGREFVVLIGD